MSALNDLIQDYVMAHTSVKGISITRELIEDQADILPVLGLTSSPFNDQHN
jgi:hypothetical protein